MAEKESDIPDMIDHTEVEEKKEEKKEKEEKRDERKDNRKDPRLDTKKDSSDNEVVNLDEINVNKLKNPELKVALNQALEERESQITKINEIEHQKSQLEKEKTEISQQLNEEKELHNKAKSEIIDLTKKLTTYETKVNELQDLNAEYSTMLSTSVCSMTSTEDCDKPYVLVIFDNSCSKVVEEMYLLDRFRIKEDKSITSVLDLAKRVEDQKFIEFLLGFNKIVVCLGQKDLISGAKYNQVFKTLHRTLVSLGDKIDITVSVVQIQPNGNDGKRAFPSMYNNLLKNQKLRGVNTIEMNTLDKYTNMEILSEDMFTVNQLGAVVMAKTICDNVKATTIKPKLVSHTPKQIPPNIEINAPANAAAGTSSNVLTPANTTAGSHAGAPNKDNTRVRESAGKENQSTNIADDDEIYSEIFLVPLGLTGLIIGKGGDTIRKLRRDTGCKELRVDSYDDGGEERDAVYITGKIKANEKAKNEILSIISSAKSNNKRSSTSTSSNQSKFRRPQPNE